MKETKQHGRRGRKINKTIDKIRCLKKCNTDIFTVRALLIAFTNGLDAFTHTDTFLRTNAFSHIVFSHAGAFTHNCFYTQTESHRWFSQLFLHRNIFTLMALHTHTHAHTHTHIFTETHFYTERFFTHRRFHTHTQTHAFLHTHDGFQNVVFWFG